MELKGIKITWIGFLLNLIGGVISGIGSGNLSSTVQNSLNNPAGPVSTGTNAATVIGGILAVVSLVLIIVGLSMAKDLSDYFRKARNLQIIAVVLGVILVVVIVGMAVVRMAAMLTAPAQTGPGGWSVLIIILVVLMMVCSLLFYRYLLNGCSETALLCKDSMLAERFRKMWKLFIISFIVIIASVIIIFAGVAGGMARSVVYGNVEVGASQMIAAMVPGIILAIVGGILMFIFEILLLVRMARLWSYDGKSVGPLDGMGAAPNQYGVPDYDNGQTYGGSQNYGGEQDYDDGQSHDGSHDFGGAQKFGDNQDQYDSPDFDEDQYYGSESESNEEE